MSTPYFRFYPTDYEADTAHLTLLEDGAYSRLLRLCWMTPGCSLPDDEGWIFRRLRVRGDDEKQAVRSVLNEFFRKVDGRICNDRLAREHEQAVGRQEAASENGKKSAAKKASLKTNDFISTNQNQNQNQEEEEDKSSLSSADDGAVVQPIDEIAIAVSAYNASAASAGWPKVQVLNKTRRSSLKARLKDCGGLDGWVVALAKAKASPHLCGQNNRGWTASFDFLTSQSGFTKLMEGNYDDRQSPQQNRQSAADDRFGRIADAAVRNRAPSRPDFGFR
ncbi:YdaU family protein [Paracoccus aminovorans]|uniref:YdaU family protein n=1 Tax=Paracoccus aminovorans TaxID=34004 RepID=UPI001560EA5B|nr:YdaU family protein [Paracoccus aminovorans]